MRYVEAAGVRLSAIGLGTWQFGSREWGYGAGYAEKDAGEILVRALELGVNLIDTAEIYAFGQSERIVGRALAGHRDAAFVATKVLPVAPLSAVVVHRGRASRARLGIDAIDLYQLHWPNPVVPMSQQMDGMHRLLDDGVIRHVGVSNYSLPRWQAAERALGKPVLTNQVQYSLVARGPDRDLVPWARSHDRVVMAYSPLGQGLLSARYDETNAPAGVRAGNALFLPANLRAAAPLLTALREVGAAHDATPAQVALAWVIRHPNVVAIPGASSVGQLEQNVAAADLELSDDEQHRLTAASDAFHPRHGAAAWPQLIRRRVHIGAHRGAERVTADAFDVIVIGAGPPGENVAGRCAEGGLTTCIVEERLVGGECSFWGCIPSKTLIRPGDVLAAARRVPGAAEAITGPIDVAAALAQRDYMVSNWNDDGQLPWLEHEDIELVRGHARLTGPREVAVELVGGGVRRLTARRAIVAAVGSGPLVPAGIEGLVEARPWTNKEITETKEIPPRLLFMGGGAIGVEMAQAFRRLGSEVTVVEAAPRLLAREEPFCGEQLKVAFEAEGITVLTGTKVVRVRRDGVVTATLDDGGEVIVDEIVASLGRVPRTGDIGLDAVGLGHLAGRFLPVDDQLRVQDGLYAVGDCNGKALLTHMGKYQGRICGDVILGKDVHDRADEAIVSRVTFTDPQVAAVGLTEAQARATGRSIRVVTVSTGSVAGAYVEGNDIDGTSALVVDEDRRVLVGATFTGPGVQELLHSATVAVAGQVTLDTLWHAVAAFPTVSEVWLRLLESYGL